MILLQVFGQNVTTYPGDGTFGSHTFEVLLMLVGAFLLGWLLHHFIYCTRHKARIAELEGDLRASRSKLKTAEADLEKCNKQAVNLKGDNAGYAARIKDLEAELASARTAPVSTPAVDESAAIVAAGIASDSDTSASNYDGDGARAILGKKVKENDLKIVEGIGPKTEKILNQSSIMTWRQLSNSSVPQLQGILNEAGDRFQLLNPGTWPKQAEMAADGDWLKLKEYQDFLVGGVEPDGVVIDSGAPGFTAAAESNLVGDDSAGFDDEGAKAVFGKRIKKDDLKIVEGIGPKIEELLNGGGIDTWRGLSNASVDRLQEILNSAGDRYRMHNPATWPKQAGLAADGKWEMLQEYQDFLDGGVEPS